MSDCTIDNLRVNLAVNGNVNPDGSWEIDTDYAEENPDDGSPYFCTNCDDEWDNVQDALAHTTALADDLPEVTGGLEVPRPE